jgi:hypothetical protein
LRKHHVNGITSFFSGLGVILLLIGIFTSYYDFGTGLVLGMICWIGSGILESFIEVEREDRHLRHQPQPSVISKQEEPYFGAETSKSKICSTCGTKLDRDSFFCPQCGSEAR